MTRRRCAASTLAALLFVFATGCERRAPGPDECHELAVAWVLGVHSAQLQGHQLGDAAEQAILERTTDCLTTPYDKELVQCVTIGSSPRTCLTGFEARHPPHPGAALQ
ncbi:MAG TPA: hypothetical protein VH062_36155 [Polyangiaceae bacterium]|nr:hypothetical protein [Polyangiaceae bacterium]